MAPWILLVGASGSVLALACIFLVFALPVPTALAVVLYLVFGLLFVASAVIFARLLAME